MAVRARIPEILRTAYKSIKLRQQHQSLASEITEQFKLHPISGRVLAARGYQADTKLKLFLEPTLKEGLPEPATLLNLEKACALIRMHADKGNGIAICCDFDVDGLSGGAQIHHFLGAAGVLSKVFVPDRFTDGYGLNEQMVRTIASQGFKLIITIDYGTTNQHELNVARSLGVQTIVVDHHHVGVQQTPADVFINPQQPGCGFADGLLSASGLAWYLVVGLRKVLVGAEKIDPRSYLDLACLGTICDMVPLVGANRVIAKRGLEQLSQTQRAGLKALKNTMAIQGQVSCSDVSFGIGPRLNAAGRMVHGEIVIELLTTSDPALAAKIAHRLNRLNSERQEAEGAVKSSALEIIKGRNRLAAGIVVWDAEFHTGVVGIVAQRLVETYYRPAVVLGLDQEGIYKGSVRGIHGFNVVEALGAVGELLIKFGGHHGAGGLSIKEENLAEFSQAFEAECAKRLRKLDTDPYVEADTEVDLHEIDIPLVRQLQAFAPFGMGNPSPQLLIKNLRVSSVKSLKGTHLKATLTDGKVFLNGIMWRTSTHPALVSGANVNIVAKPDTSSFTGVTELLLNLQAVEAI